MTPSIWQKLVLLTGANLTLVAGAGLTAAMPVMLTVFSNVPGAALWVSMIITLPALFVVVGGPAVGLLTDRFGRKPVLVSSLLLGGLAGSGGFFLNNIFAILITRALVGISVAGAMTATNALIADYFSGKERAKFMGYQSAFLGLSLIVFLPIGGFLADISWQFTFLSYFSVLLIFIISIFTLQEPVTHKPLESNQTKTPFEVSPTQKFIFVAIFILQFAFIILPVNLAYFMSEILNVGGKEVGLVGALSGLMTFIGGITYEWISRRFSYYRLFVLGFLLCGVGFICLGIANSWFLVILGVALVGFCLGINIANLSTWLAEDLSPDVRGRANGIFMTMRFLAEFIGSLLVTVIINATSFSFGFLISAFIVILTGLASHWFKKSISHANSPS
jgi:MFS family permease